MARKVLPSLSLCGFLACLASCTPYEIQQQRPAWRAAAENACFAQNRVRFSEYIQPAAQEMSGPGICGLTRPIKVTAFQNGAVRLNSTATLSCSMVAEIDNWVTRVLQPAAMARFGQPVRQINSMGSYSCRSMNNQFGAPLSEHSFANALDIGGFELADGRALIVRRDWMHGDEQAQAFFRDVQRGACETFTTVLAPGSNVFHYDHLHVDLAMHGNSSYGPRRICKPTPENMAPPPKRDNLPDAPEIDEEIDIAQAKTFPAHKATLIVEREKPAPRREHVTSVAKAEEPAAAKPSHAAAYVALHHAPAASSAIEMEAPPAPPERPTRHGLIRPSPEAEADLDLVTGSISKKKSLRKGHKKP